MDRRLVPLDHLVQNVAEAAYDDLKALLATLSSQTSDSDGAVGTQVQDPAGAVLVHLHATRQRLVRLHILLQWCHKARAMAECKRVVEVCTFHLAALKDTANQLSGLTKELSYGFTTVPAYDVATAMLVLNSSSRYNIRAILPSIIEEGMKHKVTRSKDSKDMGALTHLEYLVREKLVHSLQYSGQTIKEIEIVSVTSNGEAVLGSRSRQWTATLSLVPAPSDATILSKWNPPKPTFGSSDNLSGTEMAVVTAPPSSTVNNTTKESDRWRWRLISFRLLPEMNLPEDCLPAPLADWLHRNLEDRMWAAADIERLVHKFNLPHLVTVPHIASSKDEKESRHIGQTSSSEIPEWSQHPLAALHAVLQQASGSLAVGMVLAEQARELENGDWRDGRLRRLEGAKFQIWSDIDTAHNLKRGYTIHIAVSKTGDVTCTCDQLSWELSVWKKPGLLSLESVLFTVAKRASLLHLTQLKEDLSARFSDALDRTVGRGWSVQVCRADDDLHLECTFAASVHLLIRHDLKTGKILYTIGNDVVENYPQACDAVFGQGNKTSRSSIMTVTDKDRAAQTVRIWSDVCANKRKVMLESALQGYRPVSKTVTSGDLVKQVFEKAKLPKALLQYDPHGLPSPKAVVLFHQPPPWSTAVSCLPQKRLACFVLMDCAEVYKVEVTIMVCWVTERSKAVIGVRKQYSFRLDTKDRLLKSLSGKRKRDLDNSVDDFVEMSPELSDAKFSLLRRRCFEILLLEHLKIQCESAGWGYVDDESPIDMSTNEREFTISLRPDVAGCLVIVTVRLEDDVDGGGYEIVNVQGDEEITQRIVKNLPIRNTVNSSMSVIDLLMKPL
jgi:hypothetical protein